MTCRTPRARRGGSACTRCFTAARPRIPTPTPVSAIGAGCPPCWSPPREARLDKNALIVLLITIGIIVVVNFVMFGVVRGVMRGDNRWLRGIAETLRKPNERSDRPYDELRRRMQELSQEEKDNKKEE